MSRLLRFPHSAAIMGNGPHNGTAPAHAGVPLATSVFEATIPGFGVLSNALAAYLNVDLSSIIGTCLFVFSLASASRYAYKFLHELVHTWFTASIAVEESDDLYDNIMDWISDQFVTTSARRLTAKTRRDYPWHLQQAEGGAFNFKEFEARFPPIFAPAHGNHWFVYKNRLFWFQREQRTVQSQRGPWGSSVASDQDTLKIRTLGWFTEPIKKLIDECRFAAAEKRRQSTIIKFPHSSRSSYWSRAGVRASRNVDTVYLDHHTKTDVLSDVGAFLQPSTRSFYSRRGIPYRRGYLFWGEPGTGKTSLAFAIAGLHGLPLYVLSLSDSNITDQDLSTLFASLPMSCVVLMEDIDTIAVTRKRTEDDKPEEATESAANAGNPTAKKGQFNARNAKVTGLSLSGLLNALDGVASQEGRILIMTTNAPETLDKALIRPGRVDMEIYFGHLTPRCAQQMFECMYALDTDAKGIALSQNGSLAKSEKDPLRQGDIADLAKEFGSMIPEKSVTPAEVQGFLLRQRNGPREALVNFQQWAKETLEVKARGENVGKPETRGDENDGVEEKAASQADAALELKAPLSGSKEKLTTVAAAAAAAEELAPKPNGEQSKELGDTTASEMKK